jgi:hypothetical protein
MSATTPLRRIRVLVSPSVLAAGRAVDPNCQPPKASANAGHAPRAAKAMLDHTQRQMQLQGLGSGGWNRRDKSDTARAVASSSPLAMGDFN